VGQICTAHHRLTSASSVPMEAAFSQCGGNANRWWARAFSRQNATKNRIQTPLKHENPKRSDDRDSWKRLCSLNGWPPQKDSEKKSSRYSVAPLCTARSESDCPRLLIHGLLVSLAAAYDTTQPEPKQQRRRQCPRAEMARRPGWAREAAALAATAARVARD
jgi:hypothetical protein